MLQPLLALEQRLEEFLAHGAGHWLLLSARDREAPLLAKLLGDLDRRPPQTPPAAVRLPPVVLLGCAPFRSAEQYVDSLVAELGRQHQLLNRELAAQRLPPLPALSQVLRPGSAVWPPARLRLALRVGSEALLLAEEPLLVWSLCPLTIETPDAYLQLLRETAPRLELPPRCSVIVRLPWGPLPSWLPRDHPRLDHHTCQLDPESLAYRLELLLLQSATPSGQKQRAELARHLKSLLTPPPERQQ